MNRQRLVGILGPILDQKKNLDSWNEQLKSIENNIAKINKDMEMNLRELTNFFGFTTDKKFEKQIHIGDKIYLFSYDPGYFDDNNEMIKNPEYSFEFFDIVSLSDEDFNEVSD